MEKANLERLRTAIYLASLKWQNYSNIETSLVVQWLKLHTPNAGGPGLIPGQETTSHTLQLKMPHATTKTQHSQINKS